MKRIALIFLFLIGWLLPGMAQADEDRRWAVSFSGNFTMQVTGRNDYASSVNRSGAAWKLMAEYYLPHTPFLLKAGYDREERSAFNGNLSSMMDHLSLGGRYCLPLNFPIRPYAGIDLLLNVGKVNDSGRIEEWSYRGNDWVNTLRRDYSIRNPRFSVAPVVGADIYFLSCLALQVEYGYRIGTSSHFTVNSVEPQSGRSYETRFKGNRHAFGIGVKVTFPFGISRGDMDSIWDWILGN